MSVLVFILILSFLVLIHELGHFLMAKKTKTKIEEFGLGYPPKIIKLFSWRGTEFSLNAIPFGGFVKLEGEEAPIKKTKSKNKSAFYLKSASQRLAVILAGATVNFIFGVLAFSIIFSKMGIPVSLNNQPRIDQVIPNTPAAEAGLSSQVNIIGFRNKADFITTNNITDVLDYVNQHQGETVAMVTTGQCSELACQESASEHQVYLRTNDEIPDGQGSMGIVFADAFFKFYKWYEMPFRAGIFGLKQALSLGFMMLASLTKMFSDILMGAGVPTELAGPIGIVHYTQQSQIFTEGWMSILGFSAMLSINLAIINILPIPALDGGRAFFILLEKVFNKKRIQKIEGYANYIGFAFLLGLLILVSIRDIIRIFN
jgi:regulator of sigma E protease